MENSGRKIGGKDKNGKNKGKYIWSAKWKAKEKEQKKCMKNCPEIKSQIYI